MNQTFKKGDLVKTNLDGDGVIDDIHIGKESHRVYAYKVKLDKPDKHGNIFVDKFPCNLKHK